jgi:hypothetical protein
LHPARETCEKCHWPEKFSGDRLKTIIHYQFDQNNNPVYTTLKLKIGTGAAGLDRGSHWHIAEKNQVRYQAVDSKRKIMKWVEVRESEGNFRRYTNRSLTSSQTDKEQEIRILDCVDCHNRATHIYERAENALDERISMDLINRNLPYLKREGLDAISNYYADKIQSDSIIGGHLKDFYAVNFPETTEIQGAEIGQALTVLKEIYARNIHPEMNIYWGSYPDHLGHRNGTGCTRCHNPNLVDEKGEAIPDQCTLCHSVLSCEEDQPFKYLFPLDEGNPEYLLKKYFQDEFFENRDPKSAR